MIRLRLPAMPDFLTHTPMKRLIPILLACLLPIIAQAQDTIPNYLEDDDVITEPFAYFMPEFPGGKQAMNEYISANLHYPEQAVKDSIEGRVVVSFCLQADLSITNIEVLHSSGFALLDEEAVRVIRSMPKWECKAKSCYSDVKYAVPVNFKLQ